MKLVVCIMGQNCEKFIGMCLESVKDADRIIYCDGVSTDNTLDIVIDKMPKYGAIISNQFDQKDKKMNGKQRNFYLKYLKKFYPNDWCLCIDADEVVEDLSKIKEFIKIANEGLYSVKMRHLIGDLAHEDAMTPIHFVLNRLFKIDKAESYPEVEHPVLQGHEIGNTICTTIWHLAYIPNMWDFKKRYENHLKKSNMHTPQFLKQWYHAHLFGVYPKAAFDPVELPKIILDEFGVDKDELYFAKRGLEHKHWLEVDQWNRFFDGDKALLFGCGKGPRVYVMNRLGWDAVGIELSSYAVENGMSDIIQGSVLDYKGDKAHLVIAYDLLEHLKYEDLSKAIDNLIKHSFEHILISVPVIGDPNLENDPTHIIKETKDWWIKQFTDKGLKLIPTPDHFLFKEQVMIFKKHLNTN